MLAVVLPAPPHMPGVLWPPATAVEGHRTAKMEGGEAPPTKPPLEMKKPTGQGNQHFEFVTLASLEGPFKK